jgi:GPH family glycoside/pentoside/hexuronide:cation symporter
VTPTRPVGDRQPGTVLAALAGPALPMAAMTLPLTIFLPAFYATVVGINLAVVGLVFTVVRLADLFFDPFVGGLMDRTNTRWGRFKPWLAIGGPIVMAGAAMLFMARPGVGPVYLAIALIIAYAGYSIIILAQMGLGAALTPDYHERSRVFAWWQIFNVGGIILVLLLPPALSWVMTVNQTVTVQSMGLTILIATPVTILIALARVPDKSRSTASQTHVPLRAYLGLLRLSSLRYLLSAVLMTGLALGISASVFVFFFAMEKNISVEELSLMLAGFSVVSICSAPLWAWIGNRIGKHRALSVGGLCYALYSLIVTFMPERDFTLYAFAAVIGGFASCSSELLPRAMMADIGDEDRLASGSDRSGMLYALMLITHKIGQAVAIGIVFVLLDLIGFEASAGRNNSPGALFGILLLGSVIPGLLYVGAGIAAFFYPLTAARHAVIRRDLERLHITPHPVEMIDMTDPGHVGPTLIALDGA